MTQSNDDTLNSLNQAIDTWITDSPEPVGNDATEETRSKIQRLSRLAQKSNTGSIDSRARHRIAELAEELEEVNTKYKQERKSLQRLKLENAVLTKKLEISTDALQSIIDKNSALKDSLYQPEPITQLPELREALAYITELHQETQAEHVELHLQHQRSIRRVKELTTELNELQSSHTTLQEDYDTAHQGYVSLQEEHKQLLAELEESRTEANTAERRSHQIAEDHEALQQDLHQLKTQISEKSTELVTLQKLTENTSLASAEDELRRENEVLKNELQSLISEYQDQEESLEDFAQKVSELLTHEGELMQQKTALNAEVEALHIALNESALVNNNPEDLRDAELKRLRSKVDAQSDELRTLRAITRPQPTTAQYNSPFEAFDEFGQRKAIGEILLDAEFINETQLFNALVEQDKQPNRRLGSLLMEQDLIQEDTVAQVLASQLRLEYLDLANLIIPEDARSALNGRLASHHMCIPVRKENNTLTVAMANPTDTIALADIRRETGLQVAAVVAPPFEISAAIIQHYGTNFTDGATPFTTPRARRDSES